MQQVGSYELLGEIGRGRQGTVYEAREQGSGRAAAVKVVPARDAATLESVRREVQVLSRLSHPGIVALLGHGATEGAAWFAMERVEGEDLASHGRARWDPRSGAPLRMEELREILSPVRRLCTTLAYLHGEGVVHGDLSPRNVVVAEGGRPVLVDFGLVRRHDGATGRESLEVSGSAGTLAFMAPEQLRGEPVDARADLYALGCLVYLLITGASPFATTGEVLDRDSRPELPSMLVPGLPRELDDLVLRLLATEPSDRLGYATDAAAGLASIGASNGFGKGAPVPRPYLYRPGLTGREAIVRELLRYAGERARRGGESILVTGESGIGKTRLVAEVARRLAERGLAVVTGECLPAPDAGAAAVRPLAPLAGALRSCAGDGSADDRRLRILAPYLPGLDAPAGEAAPAAMTPGDARRRVVVAAADLLHDGAPRLVVVDDLQWADELTLDVLAEVARRQGADGPGTVLLATCREGAPAAALEPLRARAKLLPLTPLPSADVAAMASGMLALPAPDALVNDLAALAGGNPFAVGEYLRAALAAGVFERAGGRWRLARPEGMKELPLPDRVADVVAMRLGTISAGARELVDALAVLGREAAGALLAEVAPGDDDDRRAALAELLARHVLEEPAPHAFRFAHDRLREEAYRALPDERRRQLHERAAIALARESDRDPGRLALHWEHAGRPAEAAPLYLESARQLAGRYATGEAVRAYRRYLAVAEPGREARAARQELSSLLNRTGRSPEAAVELGILLHEAELAGDPYNHCNALRGLALVARVGGRIPEAMALYERALAIDAARGDRISWAATRGAMANVLHGQGRGDEALATYEEVLRVAAEEEARAGGDPMRLRDVARLQEAATGNIAVVEMELGRYDAAIARYQECLADRRRKGDRFAEGLVLGNLGNVYQALGRMEDARACFEEALRVDRETGNRQGEAIVLGNLASHHSTLGRRAEGDAALAAGIAIANEIQDRRQEAVLVRKAAELAQERGELEPARGLTEQAIALYVQLGERRQEAQCRGMLASILTGLGRAGEARELLFAALAVNREIGDRQNEGYNLLHLAAAARALGDLPAAASSLEGAGSVFEELRERGGAAQVAVERAWLARARGEDPAPHVAEARRIARELGAGPESNLLRLVAALDTPT